MRDPTSIIGCLHRKNVGYDKKVLFVLRKCGLYRKFTLKTGLIAWKASCLCRIRVNCVGVVVVLTPNLLV